MSLSKNDLWVTPIEIFSDIKNSKKKKLPTYLQSVGGIGKSRQKTVRWYLPRGVYFSKKSLSVPVMSQISDIFV